MKSRQTKLVVYEVWKKVEGTWSPWDADESTEEKARDVLEQKYQNDPDYRVVRATFEILPTHKAPSEAPTLSEVDQAIKILRSALSTVSDSAWVKRRRVGPAIWEAFESLVTVVRGAGCSCALRHGINGNVIGLHRDPFCSKHGDHQRRSPSTESGSSPGG